MGHGCLGRSEENNLLLWFINKQGDFLTGKQDKPTVANLTP